MLFRDEELLVRYVADPIFWVNRWVSIRVEGGIRHRELLLAAVDAEFNKPDGEVAWYYPLEVRPVEGVCPVEDDYCGTLERQAIEVIGDGGMSVVIFDGNEKPLEDFELYHVMVPKAHGYHLMACDDVPYAWVSAMIYRP
ncbi:MAG: hypothetical protein JRG91_21260 [Deltaproteobacteria bacterium]|nr:hypothetical protein [Deltaproteobacteria bacterium]